MTETLELRDYLQRRRSVTLPFLDAPGPDAAQLETILTIGTRVPDHGKLAPWRLVVFAGDARAEAGAALAEVLKNRDPETPEAMLEQERNRFLPAPVTIGVVAAARPHPKIPEFEQWLSAGSVCFNLVHAAYAHGFAAQWVTRWFADDAEAAQLLGAKPAERFAGFVHIGTPTRHLEDRERPALADVVSYWRR